MKATYQQAKMILSCITADNSSSYGYRCTALGVCGVCPASHMCTVDGTFETMTTEIKKYINSLPAEQAEVVQLLKEDLAKIPKKIDDSEDVLTLAGSVQVRIFAQLLECFK